MKHIVLTFFSLLLFHTSFAQNDLFDFLQGTWKMEDKEVYEHWDRLNKDAMKGISYVVENNEVTVFEYLDLLRDSDIVVYIATVVGQNEGLGIAFTMTRSDNVFSFENQLHDFPKIITYQKISDNEMNVKISDGSKEISWVMKKLFKK
jgi:predicted RND superfamily exporter protein